MDARINSKLTLSPSLLVKLLPINRLKCFHSTLISSQVLQITVARDRHSISASRVVICEFAEQPGRKLAYSGLVCVCVCCWWMVAKSPSRSNLSPRAESREWERPLCICVFLSHLCQSISSQHVGRSLALPIKRRWWNAARDKKALARSFCVRAELSPSPRLSLLIPLLSSAAAAKTANCVHPWVPHLTFSTQRV